MFLGQFIHDYFLMKTAGYMTLGLFSLYGEKVLTSDSDFTIFLL